MHGHLALKTLSTENKDLHNPANIYLLKLNNRNTRKRCEICSELTIKTPEQRRFYYWLWTSTVWLGKSNYYEMLTTNFLLRKLILSKKTWRKTKINIGVRYRIELENNLRHPVITWKPLKWDQKLKKKSYSLSTKRHSC